jgi:FMN phosphatase YigB (HAD superfamily)
MPKRAWKRLRSAIGRGVLKYRTALFSKIYLPQLRAFPLLAAGRLDDLLPDLTSSDDAGESKPAPDIVMAALAMAGCMPSEAVMLGDTPWDMERSLLNAPHGT